MGVKATVKISKAMAKVGSICAKAGGAPGSPAATCKSGRIQYAGGLINARHAHIEMAQEMMMAKVAMGVAKATAGKEMAAASARPKDAWDEHISFDSDWGQNREYKCPKFDLFGCGCAEVE